jgi:hypothetical protein
MLVNNCYQVNLKSQLRRAYPLQRGCSTLRDQCQRTRWRFKPTLIQFSCLLPHFIFLLYVFCFLLQIPSFSLLSFPSYVFYLLPLPLFASVLTYALSAPSLPTSHLSPPSVPFLPSFPTSPLRPLYNSHLFPSPPPSSFPSPPSSLFFYFLFHLLSTSFIFSYFPHFLFYPVRLCVKGIKALFYWSWV